MILHVIAGDEDAIIRTGNVISSTKAALGNPSFLAIRGLERLGGRQQELIDIGRDWRDADALLPFVRTAFARLISETLWMPVGHVLPLNEWLGSIFDEGDFAPGCEVLPVGIAV